MEIRRGGGRGVFVSKASVPQTVYSPNMDCDKGGGGGGSDGEMGGGGAPSTETEERRTEIHRPGPA